MIEEMKKETASNSDYDEEEEIKINMSDDHPDYKGSLAKVYEE